MIDEARIAIEAAEAAGYRFMAARVSTRFYVEEPRRPPPVDDDGLHAGQRFFEKLHASAEFDAAVRAFIRAERPWCPPGSIDRDASDLAPGVDDADNRVERFLRERRTPEVRPAGLLMDLPRP